MSNVAMRPEDVTTAHEFADERGISWSRLRQLAMYDQTFPSPWRPGIKGKDGKERYALYERRALREWWSNHRMNKE